MNVDDKLPDGFVCTVANARGPYDRAARHSAAQKLQDVQHGGLYEAQRDLPKGVVTLAGNSPERLLAKIESWAADQAKRLDGGAIAQPRTRIKTT